MRDRYGDERPAPARNKHLHSGCTHYDDCYTPNTVDCQKCRTKAFNDRMATRYREDQLSTEALLDRRG